MQSLHALKSLKSVLFLHASNAYNAFFKSGSSGVGAGFFPCTKNIIAIPMITKKTTTIPIMVNFISLFVASSLLLYYIIII